MYPTNKYSARSSSPTFVNFSPPSDYPSTHHHHHHHHSMSMKHATTMVPKGASASSSSHSPPTLGGGRSEIIFPEDVDSIEFCFRGNNGISCPGDSFSEKRRRGHSRRSNHKLEVEQQVKWTRKNIAATMERFEPAAATSNIKTTDFMTSQPSSINHVYSYAYYEPGAAKCHTNIPPKEPPITPIPGPSKSPPRNSIRALLARSFRSKTLTGPTSSSSEERHTYTTRYGTQENLYEEVNDQKIRKVLSDNRIVSSNSTFVKEELRRVQHNHFRVLDELNLSLEALIMPPTPPDISPTNEEKTSQASHVSMENLSNTLNSIELKDHTCINPEFDEGDLDSGFSGSGSSSGASYNESLRYYKTGAVMQTTTLPHMRSCRSSTSNTSTSKSSMNSEDHNCFSGILTTATTSGATAATMSSASSPFNFSRRCSDSQRSSSSSGTKPKKSFWMIKQ